MPAQISCLQGISTFETGMIDFIALNLFDDMIIRHYESEHLEHCIKNTKENIIN